MPITFRSSQKRVLQESTNFGKWALAAHLTELTMRNNDARR